MKYLKKNEEFSRMDLLQEKKVSAIHNLFLKVTKELKINFYFFASFGTILPILFPIFDKLVKNEKLNVSVSDSDIVMLVIFVIAVLLNENKEEIAKIKSLLKEKGLSEVAEKGLSFFKNSKELFTSIGKQFGKVILNFTDLFSYTIIYVPLFLGLFDLIELYELGFSDFTPDVTTKGFFISTGLGVLTITAKHFIQMLIRKMGRLMKRKNNVLEGFAQYSYDISSDEETINRLLDKGLENLTPEEFELLKDPTKKQSPQTNNIETDKLIYGDLEFEFSKKDEGENEITVFGTLYYKGEKYDGHFILPKGDNQGQNEWEFNKYSDFSEFEPEPDDFYDIDSMSQEIEMNYL
jgi:hypothetical protein